MSTCPVNLFEILQGRFREFDDVDWDAFSGCDTSNPKICDSLNEEITVIAEYYPEKGITSISAYGPEDSGLYWEWEIPDKPTNQN